MSIYRRYNNSNSRMCWNYGINLTKPIFELVCFECKGLRASTIDRNTKSQRLFACKVVGLTFAKFVIEHVDVISAYRDI